MYLWGAYSLSTQEVINKNEWRKRGCQAWFIFTLLFYRAVVIVNTPVCGGKILLKFSWNMIDFIYIFFTTSEKLQKMVDGRKGAGGGWK